LESIAIFQLILIKNVEVAGDISLLGGSDKGTGGIFHFIALCSYFQLTI
jgi:hypothetical protein